MNCEDLTNLLAPRVKLVRAEFDLSQARMAALLGLSKKTLIQVEKGRSPMGWATAVTLCALFNESEVLRSALGDEPLEVIRSLVFSQLKPQGRTMKGKIWWRDLRSSRGFRLQKNLVSGHYRILDGSNHRWSSSFDREYAEKQFQGLAKLGGEKGC